MSRLSNGYFKILLRRLSWRGRSFFPQSPEGEFVDRLLMGPESGKKEGKSDGDEKTRNPEPCEADAFRHWNGIIAGEFRIKSDSIWFGIFSDDQSGSFLLGKWEEGNIEIKESLTCQ